MMMYHKNSVLVGIVALLDNLTFCLQAGGEGTLIVSWCRDVPFLGVPFSNHYGDMGIIFTFLRHFTQLRVSISGDFS